MLNDLSMPVISIIIPIYNVEAYLHQCLDSVLAQTFAAYECILVDDGSPDNCPAICDEYAVKHPQVKVIHKENGGLSDARNVVIQAAIGEYIALLDSDDLFVANDTLQNLVNVIQKTKAPVIFNSNLTTFNENGRKVYDGIKHNFISGEPIQFYKQLNRKVQITGWLFVCLRSFLIENKLLFLRGILHEDTHWAPRVICAAEKIAVNHSLFYAYRTERLGSIMSAIKAKNIFDLVCILKDLQTWIKNKNYSGESRKILKWIAASKWYNIFLYTKVLKKDDRSAYSQIISDLYSLKNVLLCGRRIKYHLFYMLVLIIGIEYLHQFKFFNWK
jgi:glycosyltransferase involved in cell wall biosynthesis